jgi:hypothetical protein
MFRQGLSMTTQLVHQGRVMRFHDLVEQCLLGSMAFVGGVTDGILATQ